MTRITDDLMLKFLNTSALWPTWPMLPLRHRRDKEDTGCIRKLGVLLEDPSTQRAECKVRIGCMYIGDLNKFPVVEYNSYEELIQDWEID